MPPYPWMLILLCASPGLFAQDSRPLRFELTPYIGARFGGSFEDEDQNQELEFDDAGSVGLLFNIQASANTEYEFLYSRQETELDTGGLFQNQPLLDINTEYFHVGGTYLHDGDRGRPYIAGTLGLARFDPDPPGFDAENFFSATFGGGFKYRFTERVGVRLEGRAYLTFVDSESDIFCQTGPNANTCAVFVDGDLVVQWEAFAGITFRF